MFALPVKPLEIELIPSVTAPSLIIVFNFQTINSVCNYFFIYHSFSSRQLTCFRQVKRTEEEVF